MFISVPKNAMSVVRIGIIMSSVSLRSVERP